MIVKNDNNNRKKNQPVQKCLHEKVNIPAKVFLRALLTPTQNKANIN